MPEMPRTKFNSPWTVANIEAELNGVKDARGSGTLSAVLAAKVDSSDFTTDQQRQDALEAEDRAALIAQVDDGAKNLCNWSASTSTISGVTFTINNDDKTVSTSGTATARSQTSLKFTVPSTLKAGRYVLSGCPSGGEQSGMVLYCLYIWDITENVRVAAGNDTGSGLVFDWVPDASHMYSIAIDVRSGSNVEGLTFKPMICTAADYAISHAFVPYRPSWQELYKMILALQNGA